MESPKVLNLGLLVVLTAIAAVVLVRTFTVPVKVVPPLVPSDTETRAEPAID